MKKYISLYIVIGIILLSGIISCNKTPIERIVYINSVDTLIVKDTIVDYRTDSIDSLRHINDSLNSKLFIANYKLKRVEYYNSVAAKGNNIKYLRGWINRVLSD